MRALLGSVALAGLGVAMGPVQAPPAAGDLARQLQARYSTVEDFKAQFTHTFSTPNLRAKLVEHGDVSIKKPGRMRWTYTSPEKKEFVGDGRKYYSYVAADQIVYVSDLPTGNEVSTAVLFLTGKGDLVRDFTASAPPNPPQGEWQLALVPKTPQTDFVSLLLSLEPQSLRLLGLASVDDQGGTSAFQFSSLHENVGLPDKTFEFTPPRGAEVKIIK
jgi:outer membrane lipoprotein carrier protein